MLCWQRYASVANPEDDAFWHSQPVQLTKQRLHMIVFSSSIDELRRCIQHRLQSVKQSGWKSCQCSASVVEFRQYEWRDQCLQSWSWHRPSDAPNLPQPRKAAWRGYLELMFYRPYAFPTDFCVACFSLLELYFTHAHTQFTQVNVILQCFCQPQPWLVSTDITITTIPHTAGRCRSWCGIYSSCLKITYWNVVVDFREIFEAVYLV